MPTIHIMKYERSTKSNLWKAKCSCGWMEVHNREELLRLSADHIEEKPEWVEANPSAPEHAGATS